jgi:hypothetical protein
MSEGRRRGRPRLGATPSVSVHVKLEASFYDQLYALSAKSGESIPSLLRKAARRVVRDIRVPKIDKDQPAVAS